jgi:hypothetical protein
MLNKILDKIKYGKYVNYILIFLLLIIFLVIMFLVNVVLIYKENYCIKKNIFLTTSIHEYQKFKILEHNWEIIRDEIPTFDKDKVIVERPDNIWTGEDMNKFMEIFKEKAVWTKALSNINTKTYAWFNFPLVYENKLVGDVEKQCPETSKLLKNFNIRIAGFSLILANSEIEKHTDNTGPNYNSMALNMNLIGKNTSLFIKPHNNSKFIEYKHKEGDAVIFNSEKLHYAINREDKYRVLLYIDFYTK